MGRGLRRAPAVVSASCLAFTLLPPEPAPPHLHPPQAAPHSSPSNNWERPVFPHQEKGVR